jgi:hypothetical protein
MLTTIEYLSCPYTPVGITDPDEAWKIRCDRFNIVTQLTARLIGEQSNRVIFSPITYSHVIQYHDGNEGCCIDTYDYWSKQDVQYVRIAKRFLIITTLPWYKSRGVIDELEEALNYDIPVFGIELVTNIGLPTDHPDYIADWLEYQMSQTTLLQAIRDYKEEHTHVRH